jgi:hypothetical protein
MPPISEKIKLLIEAEIISLVPESEFFNRIDPDCENTLNIREDQELITTRI